VIKNLAQIVTFIFLTLSMGEAGAMPPATKDFDPTLQRPITPEGFINPVLFHPLSPDQRILVYGEKKLYPPSVYSISYRKSAKNIDLLADMSDANQLQHIPSGSFDKIYVEQGHLHSYFNASFFKNAARLLSKNGVLIFTTGGWEYAPDYQKYSEFLKKNGFPGVEIKLCPHPLNLYDFGGTPLCWYAKKNPGSFLEKALYKIKVWCLPVLRDFCDECKGWGDSLLLEFLVPK